MPVANAADSLQRHAANEQPGPAAPARRHRPQPADLDLGTVHHAGRQALKKSTAMPTTEEAQDTAVDGLLSLICRPGRPAHCSPYFVPGERMMKFADLWLATCA
jgi:hypothetical protein